MRLIVFTLQSPYILVIWCGDQPYKPIMNLSLPHVLFVIGITIYLVIRGAYHWHNAKAKKSVSRATFMDWLLVVQIATAQILLPCVLIYTPLLNWANYDLPQVFAVVGGLVMAGGLWLFWRSHADLGKNWSVTLELDENHRLVTHGVYKYLRHPMYASFFLLAIGQALLLNNWVAGWAALVATTVLYWVRLPHEESMMVEFFGDDYVNYRKQTSSLIPWK